jgi:hypothetical protein
MVPGERIELPTNGLQNRCSTAELTRQSGIFEYLSYSFLEGKGVIATDLPPSSFSGSLFLAPSKVGWFENRGSE